MEDLLDAHLAEVVVDAVELRLVEVVVQLGGERARRLAVMAEWLLDDDASRLGQAGFGQSLHDRTEEKRRDLQVEDGC